MKTPKSAWRTRASRSALAGWAAAIGLAIGPSVSLEAQTSSAEVGWMVGAGQVGSPPGVTEIASAAADAAASAAVAATAAVASGVFAVGGVAAAHADASRSANDPRYDETAAERLSPPAPTKARRVELASAERRTGLVRPTLPWVGVERLSPPFPEQASDDRPHVPAWDLLGPPDRVGTPPCFVDVADAFTLDVPPPTPSRLELAFSRVLRRKYYSEVRRFMKRSWKEYWTATPTLGYDRYLEGVNSINRVGEEDLGGEIGQSEQAANEWREDLLGLSERHGERDFEIVDVGPLVFMDSGDVKFDLGRAFRSDRADAELARVREREADEEAEREASSILASRDYRISTALRLSANPLKALDHSDPTWVITRYGFAVEVSWLSDVLGRETSTTEIEVEWERDGDFAALVNFVFRSR